MTGAYRSASYTRGVNDHHQSFFETFQPNGPASQDGPSMVLGQYRRHSASMTAAPIRGSTFDKPSAKPLRSASWAPDSPKKSQAYRPLSEGKKGVFWKAIRRLEDSRYLNPRLFRANRKEFLGWFVLICLVISGYKFFSDGSFSAILTLASAFQCFSLALLNMKVLSQQSIVGVSRRSLLLIVISLVARLCSTLFYNGYLPVDRSGDWVYQAADVFTVFLTLLLLVYARRFCTSSIQHQHDKDSCIILGPLIAAFILAVFIHPTLNQHFLADVAWTFALYTETFAMIPQLFMMAKLGGEVEALTSHYVASMAASKVLGFLFWYFSFGELAPRNGGRNLAGWAVILSYFIQSILFADFFYYYLRSMKVGRKMILNF